MEEGEKFVDLTVTFAKEPNGDILSGVPLVRVYF